MRTHKKQIESSHSARTLTQAQIANDKNTRSKQRSEARRLENIARSERLSAGWRKLSPQQQLAKLDQVNGKGKRAAKQRARLAKLGVS